MNARSSHQNQNGLCLKRENLLLVKMKEKKLLKIQPLPKVLSVQAIRSKQLRNIYNCYTRKATDTRRVLVSTCAVFTSLVVRALRGGLGRVRRVAPCTAGRDLTFKLVTENKPPSQTHKRTHRERITSRTS
jgi:hypothetical protein